MTCQKMLNHDIYSSHGFFLKCGDSKLTIPVSSPRPETCELKLAFESFQFLALALHGIQQGARSALVWECIPESGLFRSLQWAL